jgi:epoxyqueuosine reductase
MIPVIEERTRILKEAALRHGFMGVGISRAEFMEPEARNLENWLAKGYHGEMGYMANHFDMRVDPTKLVPGAKSVVSLMYNYFPGDPSSEDEHADEDDIHLNERMQDPGYRIPDAENNNFDDRHQQLGIPNINESEFFQLPLNPLKGTSSLSNELPENNNSLHRISSDSFKISRYAYGEDYHKVVRRKLKALVSELKDAFGDFHGRVFVDSAPVMERDWAKRSGQGWVGKNTLLIHPRKGSYFFLAEIILDVEFDYDHPMRDHCGTCTRCIDACPTDAISPEGYVLDGSKCISYLTIELKSNIPESFKGQMQDWIFGCDICQEVCPWNRFAMPHHETAFNQNETVKQLGTQDWIEMTDEVFNDLFGKTPLKRAGLEKLKETIAFKTL